MAFFYLIVNKSLQQSLMSLEFDKRLTRRPPLQVNIDQELIGHLTSYSYNPFAAGELQNYLQVKRSYIIARIFS